MLYSKNSKSYCLKIDPNWSKNMAKNIHHKCSKSSFISYISYDKDNEDLNIKFRGAGVYTYKGVSRNRFTRFCNAKSAGAYFHEHVKDKYITVGPRKFSLERDLNSLLLGS